MIFEFQRADGMGNSLDGIALTMGPIVDGVDAPVVARSMVMSVHNSIQDGIAQVEISSSHIDFGSQRFGSVWELAVFHSSE